MKPPTLSPDWVRWRHNRRGELIAGGLKAGTAWPIAKAEARLRSRLSLIVGKDRAVAAKLQCIGGDDAARLVLAGDIAGLSDAQLDAIEQLNGRATA